VRAHPLAPALLEIEQHEDGRVGVLWKRSLLRRVGGDPVAPVFPDHCTQAEGPTQTLGSNYELLRWSMDCGERGLVGSSLGVAGLGTSRITALVHISLPGGRRVSSVLTPGEPSFVVPERVKPLDVFRDYTRYGSDHILSGMDHLLFVFGLLLLARGARALLLTITCFTVGHSISLALAVFDLLRLPQSICNVFVAITIVVLAVELARDEETQKTTLLHRFPWAMTLFFGFLHGLGFAAALRQVGIPQEEIPLALFSFNLGIELGQVAFVVATFALFWKPLMELSRWAWWGRLVPVYAMGSLAVYWCIERVVALVS
jgi:hydrogenase/urease accessory protein HupE